MENKGERSIGNSSIAINGIRKELERMADMDSEKCRFEFPSNQGGETRVFR